MPLTLKKDIDKKAVLYGFLTDTLSTAALLGFLTAALSSSGVPDSEIPARIKTPSGLLLTLILGISCTVLGGYVAGRVARRAKALNGSLVAVLSIILAVLFREQGLPLWYDIIGFAAMIPAGAAGGHLAARRISRDHGTPD